MSPSIRERIHPFEVHGETQGRSLTQIGWPVLMRCGVKRCLPGAGWADECYCRRDRAIEGY